MSETTNLDVMAEKYSKKWGVPIEEAKKKVKEFLDKKPIDRTTVIPSAENPFPEPAGPISTKVQDINQSLLSTAYTKKTLAEMNQPPEQLKILKDEVDSLKKEWGGVVDFVNTTVKEWKQELETKKTQEERDKLLKDIDDKVRPLQEKMVDLEKALKKPEPETGIKPSISELEEKVKEIRNTAETAKSFLKTLGFPTEKLEEEPSPVEPLKPSQPTSEPSVEELKKTLERKGYKVTGGPITYDQLDQMLKDAGEKARQEVLDDKSIDTVAGIVNNAIKEIVEMFKPAVQIYTDHMFGRSDQPSQVTPSKEPSVSQEKQA